VASVSDAVDVSAGFTHACAVRSDGSVTCWGDDRFGQLGGPGLGNAHGIEDVAGLVDAVDVEAAGSITCARRANGEILCWGLRGPQPDDRPVLVGTLGAAEGLSITEARTGCIRRATGEVACYERGPDHVAPVAGLNDAVAIAHGGSFACALRQNGRVMCWGRNHVGQLGIGHVSDMRERQAEPVEVVDLEDVVAISAYSQNAHACALRRDGAVLCWGSDEAGALGAFYPRLVPAAARVRGVRDAVAVAASDRASCALISDGSVTCWGDELAETRPSPARISGARALGMGVRHACVLTRSDEVVCWGSFAYGAGDRREEGVVGVVDVVELGVGGTHACARRQDRRVLCWGDNRAREVRPRGEAAYGSPVEVPGVRATSLSIHYALSCAVTGPRRARCWGYEQRPRDFRSRSPFSRVLQIPIDRSEHRICLVGGPSPQCFAIRYDGTVSEVDADPLLVSARVTALAHRHFHSCVIDDRGALLCWGANNRGQLGTGEVGGTRVRTPVRVPLDRPARHVAVARDHTCAVLDDGSVACWGDNRYGQVGTGQRPQSGKPIVVLDPL
jgi:alpha-tubulin suppressor-like RCC1 family protein